MDHAATGRLWVRLIKRHRVERDATVPCTRDDPEAALRELLPRLDLSQPVWLPRHRADWEEYALTRFLRSILWKPCPLISWRSAIFSRRTKKRPPVPATPAGTPSRACMRSVPPPYP